MVAARGKELIQFVGHGDSVMAIMEENGKMYTASSDKTARVWDVNTGDEINVFRGHGGASYPIFLAATCRVSS